MMGSRTRLALLALSVALLAAPCTASRELQVSYGGTAGLGRHILHTGQAQPSPPLPSYPCRTQLPTPANAKTLWVDPGYTGSVTVGNASHPFKSLAAAWASLPKAPAKLSTAVIINLKPGNNSGHSVSKIYGTADAPVIVQRDPAADPADPPSLVESLIISNSSYVYFSGITFKTKTAGSNVIWAYYCDYLYLLNVTIIGIYNTGYPGTSQALKITQSTGVYVEDSDISGSSAGGKALEYTAVHYGHVCRSNVHHADWCVTMNGGTSYFIIDSNSVYRCGQAGLAVGWSASVGDMISPWIQYDVNNMKVTNNIIHDVWGAGLSVFGGYSVLMAHNTLYKVGTRSHTVEVKFSSRTCSWYNSTCVANYDLGGWGPLMQNAPTIQIPSKDVMFLNNLIVNPANESAKWAHFATSSSMNTSAGSVPYPPGMPNPVSVTDGFVIRGNVFVNWHLDPKYKMGMGLDACAKTKAACDPDVVLAAESRNLINFPGLDVAFIDGESLVLSEDSKSALSLAAYKPAAMIPYASWDASLMAPVGQLRNDLPFDRTGMTRSNPDNQLPGAYYDPAYQPAKICSFPPTASWAANSTGWPASCGRAFVGTVCTAPCGSNATGVEYTARCDDVDTWTFTGGGCNTKSCAAAPTGGAFLAPNSDGWDQACAGALVGSACSAPCWANATGNKYTARCDDTNTWTLLGGECKGPQQPWRPPTPPLPSYPCPRTELPTALSQRTLWIDPAYTGSVAVGNATHPYNNFVSAWNSLPKTVLTAGIAINIKPGTALVGRLWMQNVWGTAEAPLIIQRDPAAGPADPPSVLEVIDVFNCTYMYFKGITFKIRPPGDGNVVHFASSSYIYLLNTTIAGIYNAGWPGTNQALKVNQVQGIYVEDSDIYGSAGNGVGLDYVATQYGHVCRSNVHHADWCFYMKGGSAYFIIDSNTVHHCGQAGLEVGQGTGFEYMVTPWIQYEGYGMKITNNVIYNVWGAGLGVNGGYSVLMAHNSLFKVGSRSHTIEFNTGSRGSCSATNSRCSELLKLGGWGPTTVSSRVSIPSKNVMFLNNIIVNPTNESAMWAHFAMSSPINTTGLAQYPAHMPNPVTVVDGLIIRGNVFVNWRTNPKATMGMGNAQCEKTSLPCNTTTILAENLMNVPGLSLEFTDPETLVLTEAAKAALRAAAYKHAAEVPFEAWSTPGAETPPGVLSNDVPVDRNGLPRNPNGDLPGAWV